MGLNSQGDRDRALAGLLNIQHVPLAFQPDRGREGFEGQLGVLGAVCGDVHASCSHNTNFRTSQKVRTLPADISYGRTHNANMARRGTKKPGVPWFLNEWMAALDISKQVDLMERTGWSKATASQLVNGTQVFSPAILKAASEGLGVEPFELLIPPERAMAMRRFYAEAKAVVETGGDSLAETTIVSLSDRKKAG